MNITKKDIETGCLVGAITVLLALSPWFIRGYQCRVAVQDTPPANLLTQSHVTQNQTGGRGF